jgi:hypothetical protein
LAIGVISLSVPLEYRRHLGNPREASHFGEANAGCILCEAATGLLTEDEARRIAAIIAKLPELLSRHRTWECGDFKTGNDWERVLP